MLSIHAPPRSPREAGGSAAICAEMLIDAAIAAEAVRRRERYAAQEQVVNAER